MGPTVVYSENQGGVVLEEVVVVQLSSFRAVSPVWSPAAHLTVDQIQDSNSPLSEQRRYTNLCENWDSKSWEGVNVWMFQQR